MMIGRNVSLGTLLLFALAGTLVADRAGLLQLAQAQQPPSDDDKKRKDKDKAAPKAPPPKAPPPPPPKAPPPPPPPPPRAPQPPPPKAPPPIEKRLPPPEKAPGPPPAPKAFIDQPKGAPDFKKDGPKRLPPGPPPPDKGFVPAPKGPSRQQGVAPPQPGGAPIAPKGPFALPQTPPGSPPPGKGPPAGAFAGPKRFDEVQKGRQQRVEDGGRRTVIQEPGNRTIVKQDNRAVIRHDEAARFRRRPDARSEQRPDGGSATFYVRPDGVRVVTEVDASGRLVRRYRRGPDGVERNIIDNRRFRRNVAIGLGIGALGIIALNMSLPRVNIPRERYIVEYNRASDDDLYEALDAPPIEALERSYSLEEIRDNYELRARMRRIDVDTISFEFGAWEVTPDQYDKLERVARAMLRVLRRNPEAVFMIEGHADAVGSDDDNLSLSDRRASAVAEVLSETFGIPPENLVTQGYGEQYLKVNTRGPEPLNRRVTVLNITGLMEER